MSDDVIQGSPALWKAISTRAGLQQGGHDSEFVAAVRSSLGLSAEQDLVTALSSIPIERTLGAILKALQPFSLMLSELLELFEFVGATRADDPNLRVHFAFGDEPDDSYSFDLESFREHVERWVHTVHKVPDFAGGAEFFWSLSASLQLRSEDRPTGDVPSSLRAVYQKDGRWPTAFPKTLPSGDPELDEVLGEVRLIADAALEESCAVSDGPDDLLALWSPTHQLREAGPDRSIGVVQALADLHRDHWLALIDEQLRDAARCTWENDGDRQRFLRDVRSALARVPLIAAPRRELIDEVLEILSLPAWGRRYELYSAWLLTLIVEGIGRTRCQFHVVDGALSFSFRGSHLASVATDRGQLDLWAELRHPYATPIGKGRKRAVQPDYTLIQPPHRTARSAVLAVEAKQYARANTRNFRDALIDYSGAHLSASVLLANYGPMSQNLTDEPPDRCKAVGHVRPDRTDMKKVFVESVQKAVPPLALPAAEDTSAPSATPGDRALPPTVVVLQWSAGSDLDLHLLAVDTGELTNFASLATDGATPEADPPVRLWNDDRSAPGVEVAHIAREAGPVEIWVHRYSGRNDLSTTGATVHIRGVGGAVADVVRVGPRLVTDWWYVGRLQTDGSWQAVNTGSDSGPLR